MTYEFDSDSMSQTFRPLLLHWIFRLVLPVALVVWAGYLAVCQLFGASLIVVLFVFVLVAAMPKASPLWQIELRLDGQGLSGRFGKETVRVLWNDVLVARQFKRARKNFLELSCEQGVATILLDFFNRRAVWESVRRYVPPEVLEADA